MTISKIKALGFVISLFIIGGLYVPSARAATLFVQPLGDEILNATILNVDFLKTEFTNNGYFRLDYFVFDDDTLNNLYCDASVVASFGDFSGDDYWAHSGSNASYDFSSCSGTLTIHQADNAAMNFVGHTYNGTFWPAMVVRNTNVDVVTYSMPTETYQGFDSAYNICLGSFSAECEAFTSTVTRIISITPENGAVVSNNVNFNLHAYISPDDVGNFIKIQVTFRNIDQNAVALGILQFRDKTLFEGIATTTGDWYFATTTYLLNGNYRTDVQLDSCFTTLSECIYKVSTVGYGIREKLSTQFIVNEETFIGHLSQQSFRLYGNLLASTTASTTIGDVCNPIKASGTFGFEFNASSSIGVCLSFLLIPDAGQVKDSFQSFKDGFAVRFPWGYLTRFIAIISSQATTTLPAISYTFDSNSPLAGSEWNINTDDMIASGGALLASVENVDSGRTLRDVLEPIVQLVIALAVVFQIVHDLTGSHAHAAGNEGKRKS